MSKPKDPAESVGNFGLLVWIPLGRITPIASLYCVDPWAPTVQPRAPRGRSAVWVPT